MVLTAPSLSGHPFLRPSSPHLHMHEHALTVHTHTHTYKRPSALSSLSTATACKAILCVDFFITNMVRRSALSQLSPLIAPQNLSFPGIVDATMMMEKDGLPSTTGYRDAFFDKDNEGDEYSNYGNGFSDEDHEGDDQSSYYADESSDHDGFSPASPANIPGSINSRSHQKSLGLSMRDSLLAEAWKRKKELAFQDELANLREYAMPHLIGRSSSDCGAATSLRKHHSLNRSISDVGTNSSPALTRTRARSLTDDDFEELKGFIDLGFHFDETLLPAFSQTLPALEVYCAVAQSLQESPYCPSPGASPARLSGSAPLIPPWKVCSPGDSTEDVKGRLRHWAQAVACNARLCS